MNRGYKFILDRFSNVASVETKVSIKCSKRYRQRQIRQRIAYAIPQKHIVSFVLEDLSVLKFNGSQMYMVLE